MSAITVKSTQPLHLLLNQAFKLNNPCLSIRLEEGTNLGLDSDHLESTVDGKDFDLNEIMIERSHIECSNCSQIQQMLTKRDDTIVKLIESRDQLKIKLTKAMNDNIELSRQLLRCQNQPIKTVNAKNVNNQFDSQQKQIEKLNKDLYSCRQKCLELETVNQNLRNHLFSLRNLFAQFSNEERNQIKDLDRKDDLKNLHSLQISNVIDENNLENENNTNLSLSNCDKKNERTNLVVINAQQSQQSETVSIETNNVVTKITQTENAISNYPDQFDLWYNS